MRLMLAALLLLVPAMLAGCPKPPAAGQAAQTLPSPDKAEQASTTIPDTMQPPDGSVPDTTQPPSHEIGSPAADFSFVTLTGEKKRLSDYKGQPVVLNFWADWCPPCKAELPDFQEVYRAKKGQFTLLGITDTSSTDPKGFVRQNGYDWTFGISDEGPQTYSLEGWPTTYFIDRTGVIRSSQVGMMDKATFESSLQMIL